MPLVSVVLPTWNRVEWLAQSINSVLEQTFTDFELFVVDDGSTDSTYEFLKNYHGKIRTIVFRENFGVSKARNTAISMSNSEWVAFLDSDDFWYPTKLQNQIDYFKLFPSCPIHFTDEIWIRNGKRVNPKKKHQKRDGWIFQPSLNLCLISPSSVILKRELFEIHGMFDETLPVCEDYDLWLRLTLRYRVAFLNQKLMVRYGGHSDQLSKSAWGMDRYRVESIKKILDNENLFPNDYSAAKKVLMEKCNILINGFQKRGNLKEVEYYKNIVKLY
tara:strand:+ start:302 stop:1123 length:822 start_codon:yes stop_codon:yes gene_type:complete